MTNKITEKADKMRKMTDEELVGYVENRVKKAYSEGYNKGATFRGKDIDHLTRCVADMHEYVNNRNPSNRFSYYCGLLDYINNIYRVAAKMDRRKRSANDKRNSKRAKRTGK